MRLILAHMSLLFAAAPWNGSPCDQHDAVILILGEVRKVDGVDKIVRMQPSHTR